MGMPPTHMLMKGKKTAKYFEQIVGADGTVTYQPKTYRDRDNKKVDLEIDDCSNYPIF